MNRDYGEIPPCRIDILTEISAVAFDDAWPRRVTVEVDGMALPFLGRGDLLANKKAAGRSKDLADVAYLEGREDE